MRCHGSNLGQPEQDRCSIHCTLSLGFNLAHYGRPQSVDVTTEIVEL